MKLLHQPGESNTQPPYIMGHSIQVVSVLVGAADSHLAVPLAGRIHEEVKFTNRGHRTLPGKCCDLLDSLGLEEPFYFVADAYYGCKTVALRLRGSASHLIRPCRRSPLLTLIVGNQYFCGACPLVAGCIGRHDLNGVRPTRFDVPRTRRDERHRKRECAVRGGNNTSALLRAALAVSDQE